MDDPTETVPLFGEDPGPRDSRAEALDCGAAVGRYVILDRIGSGGMGVVYAAYDPELDRRVALKLLRPDRFTHEAGRSRLLREAQALARLTHPNVVAVHDAGTFGDRVFVAMELVEGETLRQWLEAGTRSWREALDHLLPAGRGLAAAHAAGLVHRDFKPENVLLGRDGRVRVVDFGLAKALADAAEMPPEDAAETGSGGEPLSPLTEWGVVLGTPAYMAPEQLRGIAADARSDQFSFCVALYEALYGQRPFAGQGPREIAEAVLRGEPREAPAGSRVPGWLREVVYRGLKADPRERYPSMDDLLQDLERDPSAVRRRWLLAAAIVLVAGAVFGTLGYVQARRSQLCGGAGERLAAVWSAERKQAVHEAFRATRLPFAENAWGVVERGLDGYLRDWASMRREACEATRVRVEQSEDLLDRRMFCLDQRLDEVGALAATLVRADAQVVEKAAQAVGGLEPLSRCADRHALKARVPPPADPRLRARVVALQRDLARAGALRAEGKYAEALAIAQGVQRQAADLPYLPLRGQALYQLGDLQERTGEFAPAEKTLRAAVAAGEAAADDEVKVRAAIALLFVVGNDLARFDHGHEWGQLAAATVQRLGGSGELRAELANQLGVVYEAEGKYAESVRSYQEALDLRRRIAGDRDPTLAAWTSNSGVPLYRLGRYAEARERFSQALKVEEAVLGPQHPEVSGTLNRIGNTLYAQGRYPEAEPYLRRALKIREAVFGPNHRLVADSLSNVANLLDDTGRPEAALPYALRSLAARRRVFGENHPDVAASLENTGILYTHLRRWDDSVSYLKQALEVRLKAEGPDHPRVAQTLHNLGDTFDKQERFAEALVYFQRALAIEEKTLGRDHPDVAADLTTIADIERRQGRAREALPSLERALKIVEAQELQPGITARTHFVLAQTLWEGGGDRERAFRLAVKARDELRPIADAEADLLAEVVAWIADHAAPARRPLD
jgi:tetratricopeptide (TPR) repeat protein/predicted Ser/Thr protein kinase